MDLEKIKLQIVDTINSMPSIDMTGNKKLKELLLSIKEYKEIILFALEEGATLYDIPIEYNTDRDVILYAAEHYNVGFEEFIDKSLLKDLEFIIALSKFDIRIRPDCENIKFESFIELIKNYGVYLLDKEYQDFIVENLKNLQLTNEIAYQLVDNNGLILKYLDNNFKCNEEVAKAALLNNSSSFQFIDTKLKYSKKFLLSVLKVKNKPNDRRTEIARLIPKKLKNDFEIIFLLVQHHGENLEYASKQIRNNIKIVEIAINHSGNNIKFASRKIRNTKSIVLKACARSYGGYIQASEKLQNDIDIARTTLLNNKSTIHFMSKNILDKLKKVASL